MFAHRKPALPKILRSAGLVAAVACAAVLIAGCGYQLQRKASLPYPEIAVGPIQNRTAEPGVEDKLSRAITEEFLKQGIGVAQGAPYILKGVVKQFELSTLSEKAGLTHEYRLAAAADFMLSDRQGKNVLEKHVTSPFFVSFTASDDMGALIAGKEIATEKAMRDLAAEVAAALMYR